MSVLELLVKKVIIWLALYSKKVEDAQTTGKLEALLGKSVEPSSADEWIAGIDEQLEKMRNQEEIPRYFQLIRRTNQTPLGERILEFAIAQVYFPEIDYSISQMVRSDGGLTMEDILKLLGVTVSLEREYVYLKETYENLSKILILPDMDLFFFRRKLHADRRLIAWLCMEDEIDREVADFSEYYFADQEPSNLFIGKEIAESIRTAMKDPESILHITGEKNAGRKYLLKEACRQNRQNMLFVDFAKMKKTPDCLIRLQREMVFYNMGICFYGIDEGLDKEEWNRHLFRCIEKMLDQPRPVCIISDRRVHLIEQTDYYITKIEIPPITRSERKALWDGYCREYGVMHLDTRMAAQKYRLNAGEIQKAVYRIYKSGKTVVGEEGARHLARVCEEVLPSPVAGQIQMNYTGMKIEDLKLPVLQKKLLEEICAQVNFRQKVFDEWGMEKKYPYGKNVSALFVGPPGTGKTMAVDIISGLINLPVYKIDLSQIVDKYIGETEKKLEEVFNLAQKSNTILFFDEADSIFGKRSEVNESKDRYANTEVSYILQRIEQYDGVVILASNFKKNIDEAFLRRMRYLVEFPMPDVQTREEIWKGCFGSEVPIDFVDFEYLAKTFEFSGGSIKNVVLNAVFLAAKEGVDVGMKQVLTSVRNEKMKMGKPMILSDFGQYAGLMQE